LRREDLAVRRDGQGRHHIKTTWVSISNSARRRSRPFSNGALKTKAQERLERVASQQEL
jgi:hypothetical protein